MDAEAESMGPDKTCRVGSSSVRLSIHAGSVAAKGSTYVKRMYAVTERCSKLVDNWSRASRGCGSGRCFPAMFRQLPLRKFIKAYRNA